MEDAFQDSGASPPSFLGARLLVPIPFVFSKTFDQRTPGVDLNKTPGVKMDSLYAAYAANPSDENVDALLADILKYAKSALWSGGHSRVVDVQEISQRAAIKVWEHIGDFKGQSKFRSWVHRIVINTALDAIRNAEPEVTLSEDADSAERLLYYARVDGPDAPPPKCCYRSPSGVEDYNGDGDGNDDSVGRRTRILSEPPDHALIDDRDDELRLEILYELLDSTASPDWLNEDYRVVLWCALTGWKPMGIARLLGVSPKQANNKIAAAKRILQKHLSKS